jgi:hypothetical protein
MIPSGFSLGYPPRWLLFGLIAWLIASWSVKLKLSAELLVVLDREITYRALAKSALDHSSSIVGWLFLLPRLVLTIAYGFIVISPHLTTGYRGVLTDFVRPQLAFDLALVMSMLLPAVLTALRWPRLNELSQVLAILAGPSLVTLLLASGYLIWQITPTTRWVMGLGSNLQECIFVALAIASASAFVILRRCPDDFHERFRAGPN